MVVRSHSTANFGQEGQDTLQEVVDWLEHIRMWDKGGDGGAEIGIMRRGRVVELMAVVLTGLEGSRFAEFKTFEETHSIIDKIILYNSSADPHRETRSVFIHLTRLYCSKDSQSSFLFNLFMNNSHDSCLKKYHHSTILYPFALLEYFTSTHTLIWLIQLFYICLFPSFIT